jgi:hypothetical protein
MDKELIKKSIKLAIEHDPNKEAILKVSLFGSHAYGQPRPDSDIDVLIEFSPAYPIGFFKLLDTEENFEKFTGRKVDLLTPDALSQYFRDEVLKKAELIYEK